MRVVLELKFEICKYSKYCLQVSRQTQSDQLYYFCHKTDTRNNNLTMDGKAAVAIPSNSVDLFHLVGAMKMSRKFLVSGTFR